MKLAKSTKMVEQLLLHDIVLKRSFQARIQGINQHTLQEYIEALDGGATFPPIDVYRTPEGELLLVDGWHRYYAHKTCCLPTIKAQVHEGTEATAHDYALYRANRTNGQRLSKRDVRELTRIAVADPRFATMSSRQLARTIGVGHAIVAKIRKETGILRHETVLRADIANDDIFEHNARQLAEQKALRAIDSAHKRLVDVMETLEFADPHKLQELVRHMHKLIGELS